MTRVAALQLAPIIGDFAENRERAAAAIRKALAAGADIIVLPELATSGYVFDSADEARSLAIPADHDIFAEWASLAASRDGSVIVAGFAELGRDGELYNSASVVDATGLRAVYRKVHLWDKEKRFFRPGDAPPAIVETAHGRLGVLICFDLEFPEWTRIAALAGADILTVPTNWPRTSRPTGERAGEVQIAMAAARVNHLAIACADRAGDERGVAWNQGTSIVSADGWVVAAAGEDAGDGTGTAVADLDLAESRNKRLTERIDLFDDRRPDLYGRITRASAP